jgi:hypothetical protein
MVGCSDIVKELKHQLARFFISFKLLHFRAEIKAVKSKHSKDSENENNAFKSYHFKYLEKLTL